jgi:hypothetical protein
MKPTLIAKPDGAIALLAPAEPRGSQHYGSGAAQRTITQDEQDRLARNRHTVQLGRS